jgi:hypothetical protein
LEVTTNRHSREGGNLEAERAKVPDFSGTTGLESLHLCDCPGLQKFLIALFGGYYDRLFYGTG